MKCYAITDFNEVQLLKVDNIRFNHKFKVRFLLFLPNWNAWREAEGIKLYWQRAATNIEHLKPVDECYYYTLLFLVHLYICLFLTTIPIISLSFAPLYRDDIVVSHVTRHSFDKIVHFWKLKVKLKSTSKRVRFFAILPNKLLKRVKMRGTIRA